MAPRAFAKLVHPFAKIEGNFEAPDETYLISAKIHEGLSEITTMRLVFATKAGTQKLEDLIGSRYTVKVDTAGGGSRLFAGYCIEAEFLGAAERYELFVIETRPWPWFLTQRKTSRIFQEKKVPDILKEVCSDAGFDDVVDSKLSASYHNLTYVVQYNETDFEFLQRRAEEMGIYWFIQSTEQTEKIMLCDGVGAHEPIAETPVLEYHPTSQKGKVREDTIFAWDEKLKFVPGKASLVDYEFTTPRTGLGATVIHKRGAHSRNDLETYTMGGHYSNTGDGETFARINAERQAHGYEHFTGSTDVRTIVPGSTFTLEENPRLEGEKDFLIIKADHFFQIEGINRDAGELEALVATKGMQFPEFDELYLCKFEVMRKSEPYRPPVTCHWPDLSGLHTAIVTGPGGEEIYTDEHGRVKVQFHWDRDGNNDENTTCWVRVLTQWAGKGYGMQSIPRIGQEVAIMFERNNPDRPYIVGMLYNGVNAPPYGLPDNMTQTGIKTETSKGGGGFNELVFEDKAGEEFVRLQSEKDYKEIIKNNAVITIGKEKADPGDMSLEVNNDQTEVIGNNQTKTIGNDRTLSIGNNESTEIGNDRSESVGNNETVTIGNNREHDISTNDTLTIGANRDVSIGANLTTDVAANDTTSIGASQELDISANQTVKIGAKGAISAAASYEIKVGGSSIKMTPNSITIKSTLIKIDASAIVQVKGGAAAKVQGGAMTIVKGGTVKIN